MNLRFTITGRTEFLAAIDYLRLENPVAAHKYFLHAKQILKRLEQFPNSGRFLPEFPDLPHREVIIPPYRFIYRVIHNTVWVVTIWHGARQLKRPES
ncbi:MAG: type II toxin-antitoxin system RelE/ParE family toxin [Magnetococcales bacterium]|nr:type II toxin-antitoxin system RelE/ParE family toxin [Magnetococcales bacterium]MBF0438658.1 type II toxin-antitoxin system RelE/ParE family toxin [Magnetococcales bacterium]